MPSLSRLWLTLCHTQHHHADPTPSLRRPKSCRYFYQPQAEHLEPKLLLAVLAAENPADTTTDTFAAETTTVEQTTLLLTPTSSDSVTWGMGLTDPGQPSAWDITGMPLGEFHSRLNFVKRATVDPLLAPGNPDFWHGHDFFVNPSIDENSTLTSLMAAGDSAAAPASNRSVYWVPSLFDQTTGRYVDPLDSSIAYYSVQKPLEPSKIVAMPPGLSIIAGNAMPSARQPTEYVFWNYIGTTTQYDHIPQGDEWQDLPLQAVVMFPQFWNGESLTGSNFKDHMAYDRGGDGGPSSHPFLLPELQLQIHYGRIPRDANLALSSDVMTADQPDYAPGWSMHADFIHTPWPERDADGNLYDGFERRVNDSLRWPTVAGTDGNAARPNPMGLDQPFTPVPIDLNPVLPGSGEQLPPPSTPPADQPTEPPVSTPTMGPMPRVPGSPATPLPPRLRLPPEPPAPVPNGPELQLAWPTPEVVMLTGVEVGIYGTVTDSDGVAEIRLALKHESGSYLRPDGSFGGLAWHTGQIVAADGHWRLVIAPPVPGAYTLTVVATDTTGATRSTETSFGVIGEPLITPPVEPPPVEPPPVEPPPVEPPPVEPPPVEPPPVEPPPVEPPPVEPPPVEPPPVEPPPVLGNQPLPATVVETALAAAIADGQLLAAPLPRAAVPKSFDGSLLSPLVSSSFRQAVPSSDWWSSVVMPVFGNAFSAPLHAHPLTVQITDTGLLFGSPTETTVAITGNTTAEYKTPHRFDLRLELLNDGAADRFAAESYGDWSFTGRWLGGSSSPTATLAQGSPVVWLEEVDFLKAVIAAQADGAVFTVDGNHAFVTVAGRTSLVLAPEGATLTAQDGQLHVRGLDRGNLAIALLPEDTAALRTVFLDSAANRPTDTHLAWDTVSDPYAVQLQFTVEGTSDAAASLVAVYPHLQRLATDDGQLGDPLSSAGYLSPRGPMQLVRSATLDVNLPKRGILPTLPAVLTTDQQATLAELVRNDPAAQNPRATLASFGDTYWAGKAMLKLAQLAQLADITQQPELRDRIVTAIKAELDDWFTASGQLGDKHFAYNAEWDTIQGYPDSFGSAGDLNDHHFHYGYFIHAAALVGSFDPAWAASQRTMIDLLVADVAGTDTAGAMLPRLRNFSPLAGHSWASGHGAFASGNNHESSSEAMNFATAVILWGQQTGDDGMTGLGQMLYSLEAEAIAEYWFNRYGNGFPEDFPYESVGMVWGDGGSHATWFSAEPEMIKGINFLPFHGGSLYLAEMARDPAALLAEIAELGGGVIDDWPGIILQYEALVDPSAAAVRLAAGGSGIEAGQSAAQTFFWTSVLEAIGTPTSAIRGDHPLSAVFEQNGLTTYVAHNAGGTVIEVSFNDGTKFEVAPGTTATWQRPVGGGELVAPVMAEPQPVTPTVPPLAPTPEPSLELVAATTSVSLLIDPATGLAFVQDTGGEPIAIRRADDYWQGDVLLRRGSATLVAAARDDLGRLRVLDVSEWGYFVWILDETGLFIGEERLTEDNLDAAAALFAIDLSDASGSTP